MITQTQLKQILNYNPVTGVFTWLHSRGGRLPGTIAGTLHRTGYTYIGINVGYSKRKLYQAHRLAWLYMHGVWPIELIDHINGIKTDNRISNLREANLIQNARNSNLRKDNTSGYKGVSFCKKRKLYRARIYIDKKEKLLGYFPTIKEAAACYATASKLHYGDFSKV